MIRTLPLLLGAVAFAAFAGNAEAGHAHFSGHVGGSVHVSGGGAHFSGGAHVNVHYSHGYGYRGGYHGHPTGRYSYGASGHIYVGGCWGCGWYGGYYPGYYYPEYVPSYYGTTYYPVQAAPSYSSQVAAIAPRPELPRFGIGVAAGSVSTTNVDGTDQHLSDDLAFVARIRLTPGLLVEGEVGKTTYEQDSRVDRRLGASLIYEIGAYNSLAPYILLGGGAQQADVGGGDYQTTQDYAEVGVGLRWALSPHFAIAGDIRAGSRSSVSDSGTMPANGTVLRTVTPPAPSDNEAEDYTRARIAAIFYF